MRMSRSEYRMIEEQEIRLTESLESMRSVVLQSASNILGEKQNIHKLHGRIGNRNTIFVDSMRLQFFQPDDFVTLWFKGLLDRLEESEARQREKYNGRTYPNTSTHELMALMKDESIREYTALFLERNFYREYIARIRAKPNEVLWKLWFGDPGKLVWGLVIEPVFREGFWTNDKSEIRRASYYYWTIGHIMATGLIDPSATNPLKWSSIEQFVDFYRSVLKRLSHPKYEQGFSDRYIDYLQKSKNILNEPFLIPELQYAGLKKQHKYRLDFTVLNSHVMKSTGFEISPASTHMAISGIKAKSQKEMNQSLSAKWANEMQKRNDYFQTYGITTITFTDDMLQNLDECFIAVSESLSERYPERPDYDDLIKQIDQYNLGIK